MAKKVKLEKPEKTTESYHDYHKCRDYLQAKFGYDERDYMGKFRKGKGKITGERGEVPYLDFWRWVIDNYEIHNGCFVTFDRDALNEIDQDWIKTIYKNYLDEFADEKGELRMYVWW